jgi:WD40 repeat protein
VLLAGLAASNFLIRRERQQTEEALQRETQALEGLKAEQRNTSRALERETQALRERTGALRALEAEQQKTADALQQTTRANEGLTRALAELGAEKETAYFQRIALAERLLVANNHERSGQLLDECLPQSRQWEWHFLRRLCQGQKSQALGPHPCAVNALAFSPDGKRLGAACADGAVRLWNAATGEAAGTLTGHKGEALAVAFSPDGKRLASASRPGGREGAGADKMTRGPRVGAPWAAPGDQLVHLAAPDATPPEAGEVKVWDAAGGKTLYTVRFPGQAAALALSPDGKWLATASRNLLSRPAPPPPQQRPGRDGEARLAPGAGPVQVALADIPTRGLVTDSPLSVRAVPVEPPKEAPPRAELTLRDAATGKEVRKFAGPVDGAQSLAFSPDGKHLASGGADGVLQVWEVETGREVLTLRGYGRPVRQVVFSPDGKRLASAGADDKVRVWDTASGQEILTIIGHAGPVSGLAFQAAGKRLATAGEDKTVKLWDAATGQEVLTLRDSTRVVNAVAFSLDGHRLASAGADAVVRVWDGTPLPGLDSR